MFLHNPFTTSMHIYLHTSTAQCSAVQYTCRLMHIHTYTQSMCFTHDHACMNEHGHPCNARMQARCRKQTKKHDAYGSSVFGAWVLRLSPVFCVSTVNSTAITTLAPSINRTCDPSEFTCNSGFCVLLSNVCDGVDDCGDYSDEEFCGGFPVCVLFISQTLQYWKVT